MIKILFFNYEYPPLGGGAANATKQLLLEYSKRTDVYVELITSSISNKYEKIEIGENIIIHRLPIGKNKNNLNFQTQKELLRYTWKSYIFGKKILKNSHFDLSHSFFTLPCGVVSLILKYKFKLPYIISLRGADVPGYSERFTVIYKIFLGLIRKIWKNSEYVVTNSLGLTELASKSLKSQDFQKIVNGIDTLHFEPGNRNDFDRKKEFRILCASRLSFRKGFIYAIDALPGLIKKHKNIKMIFAGGDGGVMQNLKGHAQALGVENFVEFTGRYTKKEAPEIYKNADIFLMPSLNEGMSNNLLEALASGLPVLMTNTGGADELVMDGKNGFLIKMKNGEDIEQKIEKIISNESLRKKMGIESRNLALKMTWKNVSDDYVELYKNVKLVSN